MRDILAGTAFLIFFLFFLWASFGIYDPGFDPLGPAFMPRLALVPIALVSVLLIVKGMLERRHTLAIAPEAPAAFDEKPISPGKPILLLILLAGYVFLLNTGLIPFQYLTPVYIIVTGLSLVPWTRQALIPLVIVAIVIPPAVAYVFKSFLFVNLP